MRKVFLLCAVVFAFGAYFFLAGGQVEENPSIDVSANIVEYIWRV